MQLIQKKIIVDESDAINMPLFVFPKKHINMMSQQFYKTVV